MVYKHISKDLKECELWLLEHNYMGMGAGGVISGLGDGDGEVRTSSIRVPVMTGLWGGVFVV
jgi:hypothetical protein